MPGALSPSVWKGLLEAQRERWILWLPPAMIAGAAWWVAAPAEPALWLGPGLLIAGAALGAGLLAWPASHPHSPMLALRRALAGLCAAAAAFGLGLGAGKLRAVSVAASLYDSGGAPVLVEGWVIANDASDSGPRLRLLVRAIAGAEAPPRFVRVAVRGAGALSPGRAARCRAVLSPPAGPMAPGAYDFARRAYFERLGATGFAFGACRPAAFGPPPAWLDRQRLRLAAVSADLSAAIQQAAPGRGGAIAAALVTGDRSSIDKPTNDALRDSGLGHLLSVSGIHMGVVGGLVFAAFTWALSLAAPIALRWPVKKIAALAALIVLGAYLLISGSSVPALRSFVMACVAFGAILLDRPAISMRGLALAAVLVTLLFPESVLEPGFQMSFAATLALVALFEMMKRAPHEPALPTPGPLIGLMQATTRGIGGVLLISFVAGLATDPFAIYHFQRFAVYALPANLIAAPVMSFLVAPAAGAAAVAAPFGLSEAPLQVMASGLDLIAAVGATFGERAEAVRAMPRPPDSAFIVCVLALLWACLWRGGLRWGGAGLLAASIFIYANAPQPIAAFDADLRALFANARGQGWTLSAGRGRSTYARDRIGAMLGLSPPIVERLAPPEACGETICAWRTPLGRRIALARRGGDACEADMLLLASGVSPPACAGARVLSLDDGRGGAFLYEDAGGLNFVRAWPDTMRRPWRRRPGAEDQE